MADYVRRGKVEFELCGGNLPEKYKAFVRRVLNDKNLVPAADVAEVVHGTPVTEVRTRTIVGYHEEIGVLAGDRSTLYRRNMVHADIPYDNCPICGATLCSRWHNFCGKCGAKMDGGNDDVSD